MDSPESVSSSSVAARESSWREWSQREGGQDGYKFGDFSRGMLHQMKAGVRDFKHKFNEATLSIKEEHEQRAVEYMQGLAATDEDVQDMAQKATASKNSTAAERFWTQLRKDAHADHEEQEEELGECGKLLVEVVKLGTENRPLMLDRKRAEKPVLLLSLSERRSKGLKEGAVASFPVREILKADLHVYTFDRSSSKFEIGMEQKAFCGGCVLPLCEIFDGSLSSLLRQRCCVVLELQLLPLLNLRKLQLGEQTGAKMPQEQLGEVVLKLTLTLNRSPARLYFLPSCSEVAGDDQGHVSDPFSVIRAAGTALVRLKEALKMELWKATMDEMRDDRVIGPVVLLWWTLLHGSPLWAWPFLWNLFFGLFAYTLQGHVAQRRLYIDEDGKEEDSSVDVVKEAVKASLRIMQLTENFNRVASQVEKAKYILCSDNWPLSAICFMLCMAFSVPLCLAVWLLQWICLSGTWRYLLWPLGLALLLPQALRELLLCELQRAEKLKKEVLGDDWERMLKCFWQRIPDGPEAIHLELFKRYVQQGRASL